MNSSKIDKMNEQRLNAWGKKERKNESTKLHSFPPLYWKPIITVTKSYTTCETAEKIVFSFALTCTIKLWNPDKGLLCFPPGRTKQWVDYLCQFVASLVKTLQLMPVRKLLRRALIWLGREQRDGEMELGASASYIIYAQHLASVGLIISGNEMLISALIPNAWAARRVWNRAILTKLINKTS